MTLPSLWSVTAQAELNIRAGNDCFTITEKAPTMTFSWMKAPPVSTFTFQTLVSTFNAEKALDLPIDCKTSNFAKVSFSSSTKYAHL